jgi:hypothetical protein
MARLPAFTAGLRRPLAIVGKIAGAMLTADMACPGSPRAILSKVSWVSGMLCFSHLVSLLNDLSNARIIDPAGIQRLKSAQVVFTIRVTSAAIRRTFVRIG